VKSMTGFGFAEKVTADWAASVEIKSYNNRYLEIEFNLPPSLSKLEERLRRFFSERARRGRIEVFIRLRDFSETVEVGVNGEAVKANMAALRRVLEITGLDEELHLAHLLRLEGIIKSYAVADVEKYWAFLEPLVNEAFASFEAARRTEGAHTEAVVGELLDDFDRELAKIKVQEPAYKEKITANVRDRFHEALGDEVEEKRVMEEIAVLFLKADFHEELVRLHSHLKSFRAIYAAEAAVGKKLDFFCQELGREINTIGSKSCLAEVNESVIECKEIIERLRELLRNVE
jgi:uncharacterized protein (TIGR00255 family)